MFFNSFRCLLKNFPIKWRHGLISWQEEFPLEEYVPGAFVKSNSNSIVLTVEECLGPSWKRHIPTKRQEFPTTRKQLIKSICRWVKGHQFQSCPISHLKQLPCIISRTKQVAYIHWENTVTEISSVNSAFWFSPSSLPFTYAYFKFSTLAKSEWKALESGGFLFRSGDRVEEAYCWCVSTLLLVVPLCEASR